MKNTAEKIYNFMDTVEKLCYVQRDIVMMNAKKESRNEHDSDHIMKLSFLLLLITPYIKHPIDTQRVLEMALVHDLVEADTGDTSRIESENSAAIRANKKESEMAAIEKYRTMLPEPIGQKIYDLFMEYEACETFESKLVKAVDKLEGGLQALKENKGLRFYQNGRYEFMLDYWRADLEKAKLLDEPILAELQHMQLMSAATNIEQCKRQGLID